MLLDGVTLDLSSNLIGDSNDETNFPNKLLLTDTHVLKFRNAFGNNSSTNIELSKTQIRWYRKLVCV